MSSNDVLMRGALIAVDASVSVGQRKRTAGRAILGKGGGAARCYESLGCCTQIDLLACRRPSLLARITKQPEIRFDCRLGDSVQ